jgi:hypothetical protein
MIDRERLAHNSAAWVDSTTMVVTAGAADLSRMLAAQGLYFDDAVAAPEGRRPICVDLWRVQDGRFAAGGSDQHTWFESAGAAAMATLGGALGAASGGGRRAFEGAMTGAAAGGQFGPLGWWLGTLRGGLAGGISGWAGGAVTGAAEAASLGARAARQWSEAASTRLGTYNEMIVAVPNVLRPGGSGRRYMYVLGILSDSPTAIWGDRTLGCGYQKRSAEFIQNGPDRCEIRADTGESTLSAVFSPSRPDRWAPVSDGTPLGEYRAWFRQPLLGHLGGGGFAVTFLDRLLDDPVVRVSPVSGRLDVGTGLISGLPPGAHQVSAVAASKPWGGFQATRVAVAVTYPIHV